MKLKKVLMIAWFLIQNLKDIVDFIETLIVEYEKTNLNKSMELRMNKSTGFQFFNMLRNLSDK